MSAEHSDEPAAEHSDEPAAEPSDQPGAEHGDEQADGRKAELERLSTRELHDRAVRRAERHVDVRFFWSLMKLIPAAKASIGDVGEADYDIQFSKGLIYDAVHSGEGQLGEVLRPVFIDYLRKHPDA